MDNKISQDCEHCFYSLHCNALKKTNCPRFLSYISFLHLSNAHQELISELKDLICPHSPRSDRGEGRVRVNHERRTSV